MSRVQSILQSARDTLADPNKERWTDDRLIRILDEGQKTVARIYELLIGHEDVPIARGQADYQLFPDLWLISRCAYKGSALPLLSYNDMDKRKAGWASDEGTEIEAILYNHRNPQEMRVYPTPSQDFEQSFEPISKDVFGVVIGSGGSINPFGVVVASGDSDVIEDFGVATGFLVSVNMTLGYIRDPKPITTIDSEMELPPMFDKALKFYVVSQAFGDDLDTQFQEKALRAQAEFEREANVLGNRLKKFDGTPVTTATQQYKGFM